MFIKPKFWDFKKPNFISYILLIFTIPLKINNFLLNFKTKKKSKKIKTICIGNIYVGGTGKTPSTIKLYELLKKEGYDLFTAKKNYKSQIDEQILLKDKTNFVTKKTRTKIVEFAEQENTDLVIFDDGLQDRKISYDIQFVCFDALNWIGNGQLIPAGPLREKLSSLRKYDAVLLKDQYLDSEKIIKLIKLYNNEIMIFNTNYEIINLKNFSPLDKYLIFSGIGNPKSFKDLIINNNLNVLEEIIYPDHYKYKKKDLDEIKEKANSLQAKIITTEKDFVKIQDDYKKNINYLKIDLKIQNENELINFIKKKINE